jgi:thioredoxin-related protein
MSMNSSLRFFSLAAFAILSIPADARTWKEAGGDRTIEGDYARTEDDKIVITRPNGAVVKIPLARLSDEDKKFVSDQAAAAAPPAVVNEFKWETDFAAAKKRAKDEKKPMLLDFTGSDWCGWCIKLKKEVFDTPEFKEYAKDNLIMVELDFPKRKELPKEEKEQNDKLGEEYKITGYPTVVLLNPRGREVARTGYQEGGPEEYIKHLKKLLK